MIKDYKAGKSCDTSFKYLLKDEVSRGVARDGIKNFINSASLTLAFNPQIKSIKLNYLNEGISKVY